MPQQARVAATAGCTAGTGIVTGKRDRIIDAKFHSLSNDLGLGQIDERRVDRQRATENSNLNRQVGHRLKGREEFRSAIGVTAVVERIAADENVDGVDGFGKRDGK